jgi:serine/threonine protein kinase
MFERLTRLVDQIHARGVAHIDLRKRDNILIGRDGAPRIIDFNASFCFEPGSLGARVLFPFMRQIDTAALLKWKSRLAPGLLTPEETRRHRVMSFLRRFWIFN